MNSFFTKKHVKHNKNGLKYSRSIKELLFVYEKSQQICYKIESLNNFT